MIIVLLFTPNNYDTNSSFTIHIDIVKLQQQHQQKYQQQHHFISINVITTL
jgi:hypothetical protein